MPLKKLQFKAGTNRENTNYANEGGWFVTNKVRFRSGQPEKIGGWTKDSGSIATEINGATYLPATPPTSFTATNCTITLTSLTLGTITYGAVAVGQTLTGTGVTVGTTITAGSGNNWTVSISQTVASTTITGSGSTGTLWGVTRSLCNWFNLGGYNLLSLASNLKIYIQNGSGGNFFDITPIQSTTSAGDVTFSATNGSQTILVTDSTHGAQTGDFVIFSGAVSLGGNITATVLNSEYYINYVSANTYNITASIAATASDTGNGGAPFPGTNYTVGTYLLSGGNSTFTYGLGWGAGGWGGSSGTIANTTINGGIAVTAISTTAITATSVAGFAASGTIFIGSEAITYTAIVGSTFAGTITRGTGSTTAAAQANGSAIYQYPSTATGWGIAAATASVITTQLRTWSQANFGENLLFTYRGGKLYYWVNYSNPTNFYRAQQISSSNSNTLTSTGGVSSTWWLGDSYYPQVCNFVMVSDASRFVIVFGTNSPGSATPTALDPMLVRWSNQEDPLVWTPGATNTAGDYRLSRGSAIITAVQTRQEILVWTDAAIYSMQFLGGTAVWGFQILGDNISILSPNCVAVAGNVVYWMGLDKFYVYTGKVDTLPSTLREYVFNDINLEQGFQIVAGTNEGYNEVWWQYCSANSTVIDRYVIFNYLDNVWYYGDWDNYAGNNQGRTAWLDSSLRAYPMATAYGTAESTDNTILLYHESGVDDATVNPAVPIVSNVQSSDFDIGDGNNFGFVYRLIPDLSFDGSTVNTPAAYFTTLPRTFPGAAYGSSNNPAVTSTQNYTNQTTYAVQQFTEQIYVRIRGRQMAFVVSSGTTGSATDGIGVQWQLGAPRIDIRPDGRR